MQILLLARSDSIFSKEIVKHLSTKNVVFDLLDISHLRFFKFRQNKIDNKLLVPGLFTKNIFVRYVIGIPVVYLFLIKNKKKYDICHMMYKKLQYFFLIDLLINKYPKVILSMFGSDYYKSTTKRIDPYIYEKVNYITFTNEEMKHNFDKFYKHKYHNKLRKCNFGLSHLDEIDKICKSEKKELSLERLKLKQNKIYIVCGTNASKNEQHELIINSLSTITLNNFSKKISCIFPLPYGASKSRIIKIMNMAKDKLPEIENVFILNKLSSQDIARLRRVTDILINIRQTDQFSAAMTETMYAGNIIITGTWLPYKILDKNYVFYIKINTIDKLSKMIINSLEHLQEFKKKARGNRNKIYKMCHWDNTIKQWNDLYKV